MQMVVSGGHFDQSQSDLSGRNKFGSICYLLYQFICIIVFAVRLLVHELSGRFGKLICSTGNGTSFENVISLKKIRKVNNLFSLGVPLSNFELNNIDLTLDSNRQDLMVSVSGR